MKREELFDQIKSALKYGVYIGEDINQELYLLSILKHINEETNTRAIFVEKRWTI